MLVRRRSSLAAVFLVVVAGPAAVHAQLANPGFESPLLVTGESRTFVGGQTIDGWLVLGNDVLLLQTEYAEGGNGVAGATQMFHAHSGENSLDLTGSGNTGLDDGVQQSVTTVPGEFYTISFWVGKATGGSFYSTPAVVDLAIGAGPRVSFTNSNSLPNDVFWQQFSETFVATSSSTMITFYNGETDNSEAGLDDIELRPAGVATTPEPATFGLAATGLFAIGLGVRRRRARAIRPS